jgi:hypothetical protein
VVLVLVLAAKTEPWVVLDVQDEVLQQLEATAESEPNELYPFRGRDGSSRTSALLNP